MHKKSTTRGKRQKQLNAQHKPNKQKPTKGPSTSHIRRKKTETCLPHVFKRVRAKGHVLRRDSTAFPKLEIVAGQTRQPPELDRKQFHNHILHQIEAKPPSLPDSLSPESIHRTNSKSHPDSSIHNSTPKKPKLSAKRKT